MKRKFLIVAFLSLALFSGGVYAKSFRDTNNHWAKEAIENVTNMNVMSGYENNYFKPDLLMSKVEFYALVNKLSSLNKTYTVTFSDVNPNDWYYSDVAKAIKAGYLIPTMGKLYPDEPITREEVCEILGYMYGLKKNTDVLKQFQDVNEISESAKGYVGAMVKTNIINGYAQNIFSPKKGMTRAEIATVINSLLDEYNRPQVKTVIDSKIKFGNRNLYE